ncbi:hypothetical protein PG994_007482 [Apiospora phragmitis]|uniref:Uncharacterized protein n=1 Tax=Apiospora phragmitis TaxID=2905665 RepID=A0ABR1V0X4_9PEZI
MTIAWGLEPAFVVNDLINGSKPCVLPLSHCTAATCWRPTTPRYIAYVYREFLECTFLTALHCPAMLASSVSSITGGNNGIYKYHRRQQTQMPLGCGLNAVAQPSKRQVLSDLLVKLYLFCWSGITCRNDLGLPNIQKKPTGVTVDWLLEDQTTYTRDNGRNGRPMALGAFAPDAQ